MAGIYHSLHKGVIVIAGFTGTRIGMTHGQQSFFRQCIADHDIEFFHHGCCVGADAQAHGLIRKYFPCIKIVLHPPSNPIHRIYFVSYYEIRSEKDYLVRNHDIVDECDFLIAAVKRNQEELRSGTWATIRYAKKCNKRVIILER